MNILTMFTIIMSSHSSDRLYVANFLGKNLNLNSGYKSALFVRRLVYFIGATIASEYQLHDAACIGGVLGHHCCLQHWSFHKERHFFPLSSNRSLQGMPMNYVIIMMSKLLICLFLSIYCVHRLIKFVLTSTQPSKKSLEKSTRKIFP